jgi:hypothetical protein
MWNRHPIKIRPLSYDRRGGRKRSIEAVPFNVLPYPGDIFWLIEFSDSSLAKDLEDKNNTYAAVNIREYWVVNLREMSCGFDQSQTKTRTDGLLPPISIEVSSIWHLARLKITCVYTVGWNRGECNLVGAKIYRRAIYSLLRID